MEKSKIGYYNDGEHWSNSMFSKLEQNEVDFDEWMKSGCPSEISDTFAIGQYLHSCLLSLVRPFCTENPDKDENQYLVIPKDMPKRTTREGKIQWEELTKGYVEGTYYTIKEEDCEKIERLTEQFFNDYLLSILENAKEVTAEKPIYGNANEIISECDIYLPLKAKYDLMIIDEFGRAILLDWKSTSSYSDFKKKAIYSYNYARQAYMYTKLSEAKEFSFVVFDTTDFNRWKLIDVDMDGAFFERGKTKLIDGVMLADRYLCEGIDSEAFKHDILE
jgi:hypothetical protein